MFSTFLMLFGYAALVDDDNSLLRAYDGVFPVVKMRGEIVGRTDSHVIVHMYGEKLRLCKFVKIQGYSKFPDGTLKNINIDRTDVPFKGETRPLGKFNIGTWRLWPIDGARGAAVYIEHDCDKRPVLTKIADVSW